MLASRGYNIDSLAVGETEDPHLSRMTFVVVGDDSVLEQVRKQLEKIVTVVRVDDISSQDHVERDLMLIKVAAPAGPPHRDLAADRHLPRPDRGRRPRNGDHRDLRPGAEDRGLHRDDAAVRIVELARTGRIAMVRGKQNGHGRARETVRTVLRKQLRA